MKFENKWNGRRLGSFNVEPYLKSIYGENIAVKKVSSFKLYDVKPLLQNDYGDDSDCSITSITTCILKYAPFLKDTDVYNIVAEYGKSKSFYNGKLYGTIAFSIKNIFDQSLKKLKINLKTKSAYIKGVGFNLNSIKTILNNQKPIILTMHNDGRDYYKMHSITIIGYDIYSLNNKKTIPFLLVYDNWTKTSNYIDYTRLSSLSCINY